MFISYLFSFIGVDTGPLEPLSKEIVNACEEKFRGRIDPALTKVACSLCGIGILQLPLAMLSKYNTNLLLGAQGTHVMKFSDVFMELHRLEDDATGLFLSLSEEIMQLDCNVVCVLLAGEIVYFHTRNKYVVPFHPDWTNLVNGHDADSMVLCCDSCKEAAKERSINAVAFAKLGNLDHRNLPPLSDLMRTLLNPSKVFTMLVKLRGEAFGLVGHSFVLKMDPVSVTLNQLEDPLHVLFTGFFAKYKVWLSDEVTGIPALIRLNHHAFGFEKTTLLAYVRVYAAYNLPCGLTVTDIEAMSDNYVFELFSKAHVTENESLLDKCADETVPGAPGYTDGCEAQINSVHNDSEDAVKVEPHRLGRYAAPVLGTLSYLIQADNNDQEANNEAGSGESDTALLSAFMGISGVSKDIPVLPDSSPSTGVSPIIAASAMPSLGVSSATSSVPPVGIPVSSIPSAGPSGTGAPSSATGTKAPCVFNEGHGKELENEYENWESSMMAIAGIDFFRGYPYSSNLKPTEITHILSQADNRFAGNLPLLFKLFSFSRIREVARRTSNLWKYKTDVIKDLNAFFERHPNYITLIENPALPECQELARLLRRIVRKTASNFFGGGDKENQYAKILNTGRWLGNGVIFGTVNPSLIWQPVFYLHAAPVLNNAIGTGPIVVPADLGERKRIMVNNPVASAALFQEIQNGIEQDLFALNPHQKNTGGNGSGIAGVLLALNGAVE